MVSPNLRHRAKKCVERARELIEQGDEASARHAALDLRFAIEYVTYDQLRSYIAELGEEARSKWTPKQVIEAMLEVDPTADQGVRIWIGEEHSYGVPPPAEEMKFLGEDRRFSLKWANKNHNSLGSFLHAPTLHQIENEDTPTPEKMLRKLQQVADECDRILSSSVFNSNLRPCVELDCGECGTHIRHRTRDPTANEDVVCPNEGCGAVYETRDAAPGTIEAQLRRCRYNCC